MAKKKKRKESLFAKVRLLPTYWKAIATAAIFLLGGISGTQLFTASDDILMVLGALILCITPWLIIQIWWPKKD